MLGKHDMLQRYDAYLAYRIINLRLANPAGQGPGLRDAAPPSWTPRCAIDGWLRSAPPRSKSAFVGAMCVGEGVE